MPSPVSLSLPAALLGAAPALMCAVATSFCPMKRGAGSGVPFRPPAYVFGFAWAVLYGLLGASTYLAGLSDDASLARVSLHLLLGGMLAGWVLLDSCGRRVREGVWLLVASVLVCAYAMAMDAGRATVLLLLPLLVWLSFAALMSAFRTVPVLADSE